MGVTTPDGHPNPPFSWGLAGEGEAEVETQPCVGSILIYDNSLYAVEVGWPEVSDLQSRLYKVRNKQYDVVEGETTVLMRALSLADEFRDGVIAHCADTRGDEALS